MSAFTVHEPPTAGAPPFDRAESLVFVRDGFSWSALLFGPFYLAFKGQWLGLAAYIAAAVVVTTVMKALGAEDDWLSWAFVILNVVTGFEASELRRWSLARAGWREIGAVSGAGLDEAERRFFEAWLPDVPATSTGYESGHPTSTASHLYGARETVRSLADRFRGKFAPKA